MSPIKPAYAASGSNSAPAGLIGGPKVSAPTDVKDFGRVNPKSCKLTNLASERQLVADTAATADADPLGVDMNVTFDNVGGLDGRKWFLQICGGKY
jgi:hypothetical protein